MNQADYTAAMTAIELANTSVSAADSKKARQHATAEAEKARNWQEEMYDRQLDDQIAWRTHQEQYNSPEAQMKRYRDAGVNPMYAITGSGQNTVMTPYSASVPMTNKADTPAPRNLRFDPRVISEGMITKAQVKSLDAQTKATEAQANMYNAQANEANTRAEGLKSENVGKQYEADVYQELRNIYTNLWGQFEEKAVPMYRAEAWIRANKMEYDHLFVGMNFRDAKDNFEHLKCVREFERDLNNHQRSKFKHELSQAESAAEVFGVTARWAVANQWINAGGEVLGAAASLFGAVKGTSFMPTHSRSYSESFGDHTTRSYNTSNSTNHTYNHNAPSSRSVINSINLP